MLKKYSNLIIISAVVVLFGVVLYVFQNTEGLRSFAASSRNQVCVDAYGAGWYASGTQCAFVEKLYVPVNTSGTEYCRNSGPYIPPSSTDPYGYCKKIKNKPYPKSSTPKPAPAPAPAPTTNSMKISPASLGAGQVGKQYPTTVIKVVSGSAPYYWDTIAGQVPPGLELVGEDPSPQRILAGIPTVSGSYKWSVGVRDSKGAIKTQEYTMTINDVNGNPPAAGSGSGGSGDTGTGTTSGTIDVAEFNNPLNVEDIPSFLVRIINILLSVVGILAVLFIIYGGLRYITSSGNQTAVTAAKNTVIYALLGLIVSVLSFAIVQVLTNLLINK